MKTISERISRLDSTTLKFIALITMAIDHVGMAFFPGTMWLRAIGRIAMPIFAFCIAEGFVHTRNRGRYLLRLVIFAAVSELPYDLAVSGAVDWQSQNVIITFALSAAALICFDWLSRKKNRLCSAAAWTAVVLFAGIAALAHTDYGFAGVALVFGFYILRDKPRAVRIGVSLICFAALDGILFELWCLMSAVPLLMYNGERGAGLKWTFYLFYPLHLLMIYFALLGLMRL